MQSWGVIKFNSRSAALLGPVQTLTPGAGIYIAPAVVFNGSTYLTRGADWTGVADGKQGIVSFWVKKTGGDGAAKVIYNDQSLSEIQFSSGNKIRVDFYNSAVGQVFRYDTTTSVTTASGWVHVLASWNATTTTFQMYLNDASDQTTISAIVNDTIDYSRTNHTFGARDASASNVITAEIADFYFNQSTSLDLSSSANRRLFISSSLKPVYLGPTGSIPTGAQPLIFLTGNAAAFSTNSGSGGGMTVSAGSLSNAATSPSS